MKRRWIVLMAFGLVTAGAGAISLVFISGTNKQWCVVTVAVGFLLSILSGIPGALGKGKTAEAPSPDTDLIEENLKRIKESLDRIEKRQIRDSALNPVGIGLTLVVAGATFVIMAKGGTIVPGAAILVSGIVWCVFGVCGTSWIRKGAQWVSLLPGRMYHSIAEFLSKVVRFCRDCGNKCLHRNNLSK